MRVLILFSLLLLTFPAFAAADVCTLQEQAGPPSGSRDKGEVTIENLSGEPLVMYWLRGKNQVKEYGVIKPGKSKRRSSYVGHVWLLKSLDGACRGVLSIPAQPGYVMVGPGGLPQGDVLKDDVWKGVARGPGCRVGGIPNWLDAPLFYDKYCDAGGFPVIAASQVPPEALNAAADIVIAMTSSLPPGVKDALIDSDIRAAVIGKDQGTGDIPEYAQSVRDKGYEALNKRARGLGGRISSVGEENLLCYEGDRYRKESIMIHEFSHTIWKYGLIASGGQDWQARLDHLYANAAASNRWVNKYSMTNEKEFWAEGVQSYFNANYPSNLKNGAETREGLRRQDPALYQFVEEIFGRKDIPHCRKGR